mmetsp:Transcript_15462/g.39996  ORF Transcript_15462/g.39996 Transcript_15462/m.39996 type:complete len:224 (+) Transcript_15462:1965-2636(+)
MSFRPSIVATSCAGPVMSKKVSWPLSDDVVHSRPSGRNVIARTSVVSSRTSRVPLCSKISHSRAVPSHDADASIVRMGEKATAATGPVCPESISRSRPVFMDHTQISNVSTHPADIISPLGSTATLENWVGSGVVKVRKLRYRTKSKARTVPSSEADNTTSPDWAKTSPDTSPTCSVNVITQNPEDVSHSFTLPSAPPDAKKRPSGAWAMHVRSLRCPCCLRT